MQVSLVIIYLALASFMFILVLDALGMKDDRPLGRFQPDISFLPLWLLALIGLGAFPGYLAAWLILVFPVWLVRLLLPQAEETLPAQARTA